MKNVTNKQENQTRKRKAITLSLTSPTCIGVWDKDYVLPCPSSPLRTGKLRPDGKAIDWEDGTVEYI